MITLDHFSESVLSRDCGARILLSRGLDELAPWLITPELRCDQQFAPFNGSLTTERPVAGACLVPIVFREQRDYLRSATLFPLHWSRTGHDRKIPPGLLAVADQVLDAFRDEENRRPSFGLRWMCCERMRPPTLPLFQSDKNADAFPSAWVPLAAGLVSAIEERRPSLKTVATGAWDRHTGLSSVDSVKEKAAAVMGCYQRPSAKEYVWDGDWPKFDSFCVVDGNNVRHANAANTEFRRLAGTELGIIKMIPAVRHPRTAIGRLLASQGAEPSEDTTDISELTAYYQWLIGSDRDRANAFYQERLYKIVSSVCAGAQLNSISEMPERMIAAVSTPALIGIAVQLFRIKSILLFYTVAAEDVHREMQGSCDFSSNAAAAKQLAINAGCDPDQIQMIAIPFGGQLSRFQAWSYIEEHVREPIGKFLSETSGRSILWEMTSGLRVFSHVFEKVYARRGDLMSVINSLWRADQGGRIPLTEELIVWRHKA